MHVAKEIDNHGLSMRAFDSIEAATTWALYRPDRASALLKPDRPPFTSKVEGAGLAEGQGFEPWRALRP
jgi:hypothetical protein